MVTVMLNIADICIKRYRNYCSSHYIFSALLTLKNNAIIIFQDEKLDKFNSLKDVFVGDQSSSVAEDKRFDKMELPAIPNINHFLSVFLKLQDGVNFFTKFPESHNKFIRFQSLVQLQDHAQELRRFQVTGYEIKEDERVFKYLCEDYKLFIMEDSDKMIEILKDKVGKVKEREQRKGSFFGSNYLK